MTFLRQQAVLPTGPVQYHMAGEGRPILYLHGGRGLRITPALHELAASCRVYALDIPGFADTPRHPAVGGMADLARVSHDFIDTVVGAPTVLLGHSFGAHVSMWHGIRFPGHARGLVLEGPSGARPPGSPVISDDTAALARLRFAHPERVAPDEMPADLSERNLACAYSYLGYSDMAKNWDDAMVRRLPEIREPALILLGDRDGIIPLASGDIIHRGIRGSRLVVVKDCAHFVELDQPALFLAEVRAFLATTAPSAPA